MWPATIARVVGSQLPRESHAVRRLCDEVGNRPRLRHVDGMTALDLDDSRTSAFGHGALRVWRNHLVFGRDEVPARLRLPCGFSDRAVERFKAPRNLRIRYGERNGNEILVLGRIALQSSETAQHVDSAKGSRHRCSAPVKPARMCIVYRPPPLSVRRYSTTRARFASLISVSDIAGIWPFPSRTIPRTSLMSRFMPARRGPMAPPAVGP